MTLFAPWWVSILSLSACAYGGVPPGSGATDLGTEDLRTDLRDVDLACAGKRSGTNIGCGARLDADGNERSGVLLCLAGRRQLLLCDEMSKCEPGLDTEGVCVPTPCDPATAHPYCDGGEYVFCGPGGSWEREDCGDRICDTSHRYPPREFCVDTTSCEGRDAMRCRALSDGRSGVEQCDPRTGEVRVVVCDEGRRCVDGEGCLDVRQGIECEVGSPMACLDDTTYLVCAGEGEGEPLGTWQAAACGPDQRCEPDSDLAAVCVLTTPLE